MTAVKRCIQIFRALPPCVRRFIPALFTLFPISGHPAAETFTEQLGPYGNTCGITYPAHPVAAPGLIIWFHGGMRSGTRDKGKTAHTAIIPFIDTAKYCLASPSAFAGEDWLSENSMESTKALVAWLLAHYPINRNDINLVGVSDGCLAVIYYSLVAEHPINRRLLLSSAPQLVISEKSLKENKILYQGSWHFFQGGKDRLFPAQSVLPFLRLWENIVPETKVHWYPEGLHDFSYYADSAGAVIREILK